MILSLARATLVLVSVFFFSSCGDDILPTASTASTPTLPTGASLTLDAANISGDGSTPASTCAVTTWTDLSGNSNSGTLHCASGGGWSGSGTSADPYRIDFDGSHTYVSSSFSPQPSTMTSTTWVAWVKPSVGTFQHILSLDNHGGAWNRSVTIDTSAFSMFVGGPSNTWTSSAADVGSWQHIAVVFSPSDVIFYKNGTADDRGSAPTSSDTAQTFTIGRSAGGSFDYFQGSVAWLAVYPRVLTATEVSNACKALQSRFAGVACN